MQLSDTITDRVVYSVHLMLNDWNGYDDKDCDEEDIITFEKFFSVKTLTSKVDSNKSNFFSEDLLIVM
jgi:hypothetical protein